MNDCHSPSDDLFQLLAENCPGVIFLEVEQQIVFISSGSTETIGYTPAELQSADFSFKDIFVGDSVAKFKAEMRELAKENPEPRLQKQLDLRHKDGSIRNCILSIQKMKYQGKKAYLGIITDVTEMSQANRRLSQLQQRYWALFEAASDGIFLETLDGIILDCNAAAANTYGYNRDELMGMHARELVSGASASSLKAVAQELEHHQAIGRTLQVVSTGKRKDGTIFPTEVTVCPVVIDAENLYLVTVRDISSRRELEKSRKRYDHQLNQLKLLDNFSRVVNGLANDFNNILTGIMGYADLILRDLSPASPAREKARKILEASRKGGEFIQQLISTTGRLPANFQCAEIGQVVKEMVPELSEKVNTKAVLTYVFAEDLPKVTFDPRQIKIAIENLVANSADAMEEEGRISLVVTTGEEDFSGSEPGYFGPPMQAGQYLLIKVSDNGQGISPESILHVFEPFYTTRFAHRGLGLATVLGIVRRHRGSIMVKSKVGKGSEFYLMLPIEGKTADNSEAVRDATPVFPAGSVLIVEDEENVAEVLCAQLESLGFATYHAADGDAGLKLFKELNHNLNLVILDLVMPGKTGHELLRELRWLNPEIPVVICTGMNEIDEGLNQLGISAVIRKPFRLEQIEEALVKSQLKIKR